MKKPIETTVTKRADFTITHKAEYISKRTEGIDIGMLDSGTATYGGFGIIDTDGKWVLRYDGKIDTFYTGDTERKAESVALSLSIANYIKRFDGYERTNIKVLGRIGNGKHSHALTASMVELDDCYLVVGAHDACGSSKWTASGKSALSIAQTEWDGALDYSTVTCSKCKGNI